MIVLFFIIFFLAISLFVFRRLRHAHVAFVGEHNHVNVGAAMFFNFLEPTVDVVKAFTVSEIKDNKDTIGSFIVGLCDRSVALLPGRVPNLQSNRALIDLKCAEPEVDANS